jgi:DNA adenine methylase
MYINPPMNYTGSKFKLLPQILPLMDYNKDIFIDMFAGGGSVYTNVVDKYQKIVVNDIIENIINIHKTLILNPRQIITETKLCCNTVIDKNSFNVLRAKYNEEYGYSQLWH